MLTLSTINLSNPSVILKTYDFLPQVYPNISRKNCFTNWAKLNRLLGPRDSCGLPVTIMSQEMADKTSTDEETMLEIIDEQV
jgi:hypothetical protein